MSKKRKKGRGKQRRQHNPSRQARIAARAKTPSAPMAAASAPEQAAWAASTTVALDPLAPLIIRSGRPFDGQSGPEAPRFPPPSTLAGCLRTAWARETGQDFGSHLRALAVSGPLLLDRQDTVLLPKPADAHYFRVGESTVCVRAKPSAFDAGCGSDLPNGLSPLQLTQQVDGKPASGPLWWTLKHWLDFRRGEDVKVEALGRCGWSPGAPDRRTHVAIDRRRGAATDGKLFQTEGLVLDGGRADDAATGGLRLLARSCEALGPALVHLGGERRLSALEPMAPTVWPTPPTGWLPDIANSGGICLTLLTPGVFSAGHLPGWLDAELIGSPPTVPGLRLQLCAAALERWQAHSGWDLVKREPRPTRKLVPSGATYWFRLIEGVDEEALRALWLANVSDDEQDRLDGFGLAVPGPWTPLAAKS